MKNKPANDSSIRKGKRTWLAVGLFALFALVTAAFCNVSFKSSEASEAGVVLDLPYRLLGMFGQDGEVSEGERVILPKDTEFAKRSYSDMAGNTVNCQIVLAGTDRRSIHRPEICLPAQGWTMKASQPVEIDLKNGGETKVTMLDLVRKVEVGPGEFKELPMVFMYWFVAKNYSTNDNMTRILKTNFDMLFYNKMNRWAYVIVSAPVLKGFTPGGKDKAETIEMLKQAVQEVVPAIQKDQMNLPNTQNL
ncbi:MAG: exosortase-associated EpsI family protein [Chthoniobacterales bacterium]